MVLLFSEPGGGGCQGGHLGGHREDTRGLRDIHVVPCRRPSGIWICSSGKMWGNLTLEMLTEVTGVDRSIQGCRRILSHSAWAPTPSAGVPLTQTPKVLTPAQGHPAMRNPPSLRLGSKNLCQDGPPQGTPSSPGLGLTSPVGPPFYKETFLSTLGL